MSFFYWWRAHNPFETDEGVDEDAIDDEGSKDGKKQDEVFQLYIWHVLIRRGCCGEMNGIFERSDFINSLCWETEVLLRPRGGRGMNTTTKTFLVTLHSPHPLSTDLKSLSKSTLFIRGIFILINF